MIDDALFARSLSWTDAQSLLHERFEFFPDEAGAEGVALEVVGVRQASSSGSLRQFAIVFRGPPAPAHAQGTYRFRHARLGDYAIFVTPIARGAEGTDYEACFSHAA